MADERRIYEDEGIYTPTNMEEGELYRDAMDLNQGVIKGSTWHMYQDVLGDVSREAQKECAKAIDTSNIDLLHCPYPESITDTVGYLGVDPKDKKCKEDMDYAYRMEQIELRAKMGGPGHEALMGALKWELNPENNHSNALKSLRDELEIAADIKRTLARASKRTEHPEASQALAEGAEHIGAEAFEKQNRLLETLEYAVGIRKEPLTEAHGVVAEELMGSGLERFDDLAAYTKQNPPKEMEQGIKINFANFDNTLTQRYMAHPQNYGNDIKNVPTDYKNPDVAQQNATAYVSATVAPTMDALYDHIEGKMQSANQPNGLNRGNLIVVDGKTVAERMKEIYKTSGISDTPYSQWYGENLNKMTNELVGAAVVAGRKVEAHTIDQNGRVRPQPTTIQKEGYEPSPLKPVSMHGWHRLMHRFGLYKDRKEAHDAYQTEMQEQEAMKSAAGRVRAQGQSEMSKANVMGPLLDQQFYTEVPPKKGETGLRSGRLAHVTGARSLLLAKGYTVEEVFTEGKIPEAKLESGQEYLNMVNNPTEENWKKIGEAYAAADQKVTAYMEERHKTVDFGDIRNEPDYFQMKGMSAFLHDAYQECSGDKCVRSYVQYGKTPDEFPPMDATHDDLVKMGEDRNPARSIYYQFYSTLGKGDEALASRDSNQSFNQQVQTVICEKMMTDTLQQRRSEEPNRNVSELVDGSEMFLMMMSPAHIAADCIRDIKMTNQMSEAFADDLRQGKLADKLFQDNMALEKGLDQGGCQQAITNKAVKGFADMRKDILSDEKYRGALPDPKEQRKQMKLAEMANKQQKRPRHEAKPRENTQNTAQNTAQKGGRSK